VETENHLNKQGVFRKANRVGKPNKKLKMKKIGLLLIGIMFLFTSCGIHNGLTSNINNHQTEVVLSQKNYKVIDYVKGEATATYVFGIGGISKKALIQQAKANMLKNADIVGGSKAVINETVEIHQSFFPIVTQYTVTVSAHIIEFIE
jgi:hypothetical protein